MIKNIIYFLIFFALVTTLYGQGETVSPSSHPVLVINTNYKGVVNSDSIKIGKVFILVKTNPSKLIKGQPVFQTKEYNVYTVANWHDLKKEGAFKKIRAAKFNKNGTIKVVTLANIGYSHLQIAHPLQKSLLVDNHGDALKIQEVMLPFMPHPVYQPEDQEKK